MAGWLFTALLLWPRLIEDGIWGLYDREAATVVKLRTGSELSVGTVYELIFVMYLV